MASSLSTDTTNDSNRTIDDIQLIFIELPKFKPTTHKEKKLAVLWMRFLTEINEQTEHTPSELLSIPEIKQAISLTEIAAYSSDELRQYEKNWDAIRTHITLLEDRFEEGEAKGMARGMEKGRAEAHEKNKKEKQQMIKRLHQSGVSIEVIMQSTGLSSDEISRIIDDQ